MKLKIKRLLIPFFCMFVTMGYAQHKNWIDFNKNGKMDPYENPSLNTESRLDNLISLMTLEEKIGQTLMPFGWIMFENSNGRITISDTLKNDIAKRHIGGIWAILRADPWTGLNLSTGLNMDIANKNINSIQKYVIENSRLGIPLFLAEEVPHGVMSIGATVFPSAIGQASTWNPDLIKKAGEAIAREVRRQGSHIGYGPVLDIARDPRWSRVEETYGEDTYLISEMGAAFVKGLTANPHESIIPTLKHFAAYGWTEGGHNGGSTHMGESELNEIALPPFKAAIDAGAMSVMASYNEIDGTPCSSSKYLLTDVLRNRWNFKGFVVSDLNSVYGLVSHGVAKDNKEAVLKAIKAGLDMDLGAESFIHLKELINEKKLPEDILDNSVRRIMALKFKMGLFDNPYVSEVTVLNDKEKEEHRKLSKEIAKQSIILLENKNSILPLSKNLKSIAVIGPNADNIYNMLGDYTNPQTAEGVTTVYKGIKNKLSSDTKILYAKGCSVRGESEEDFNMALDAAKKSEVVIMVLGGSSARDFSSEFLPTGAAKVSEDIKTDMECGEGYDRATLDIMGKQNKLLQEIYKLGKPVVLVLIKGRPLLLNTAKNNSDAIIDAWYPGMEGGNAIADVIFGDYNPAGRLPVSVPRSVGQLPVFYNPKRHSNRLDYIDESPDPLYNFGYGLSYTTFEYGDLSLIKKHDGVTVAFSIKNSGDTDGEEVVQLYIKDNVSSHTTPLKQLKAFKRIKVKAGETKPVRLELSKDAFSLYQGDGKWQIEPGTFTIMIGASSADIRKTIEVIF